MVNNNHHHQTISQLHRKRCGPAVRPPFLSAAFACKGPAELPPMAISLLEHVQESGPRIEWDVAVLPSFQKLDGRAFWTNPDSYESCHCSPLPCVLARGSLNMMGMHSGASDFWVDSLGA